MSNLCGLRSQYKPLEKKSTGSKQRADENKPKHLRAPSDLKIPLRVPRTPGKSIFQEELSDKGTPTKGKHPQIPQAPPHLTRRRKSFDFEWAREDQLSVILERLDIDSLSKLSSNDCSQKWEKERSAPKRSLDWERVPRLQKSLPAFKRTRFLDQSYSLDEHLTFMSSPKSTGTRMSPSPPRPIEAPPTDVSCCAAEMEMVTVQQSPMCSDDRILCEL